MKRLRRLSGLPPSQPSTANESNTECHDELMSRHNADSSSILNEEKLDTALTIDTPQQRWHLENMDKVTPEKLTDNAKSANALITLSATNTPAKVV